MEECIFCKIANHEQKANIVYEDEEFIAFKDINPQAKIHILLTPRKHTTSISTLDMDDADMLGRMIIKSGDVAQKLGIDDGFRLVFNSGKDAGMVVDHLHLHILGGEKLGSIA